MLEDAIPGTGEPDKPFDLTQQDQTKIEELLPSMPDSSTVLIAVKDKSGVKNVTMTVAKLKKMMKLPTRPAEEFGSALETKEEQ